MPKKTPKKKNRKLVHNTRWDPKFLKNWDDYDGEIFTWYSFYCTTCGKYEKKWNVSLENSPCLICGPCLRKKKCLERYWDPHYNNPEKMVANCRERGISFDNGWRKTATPEQVEQVVENQSVRWSRKTN